MFKVTTFLPALPSSQLQVKQDLGICWSLKPDMRVKQPVIKDHI